jgi:hypothetical protein
MDPDQFPSFDETLEAWRDEAEELPCNQRFPLLYTGTCSQGEVLFIKRSDGYDGQARYFRADDGSFIAVTSSADVFDGVCGGVLYWPAEHLCRDYVVTEVLCGKSKRVGDRGDLVMR